MRKLFPLLFSMLLTTAVVQADDRVRDAQAELKNEGFYFGEVDGVAGPQFSAAVRRYQIRNGLEVTGEINTQVLQSLGIGSETAPAPAPAPSTPAPSEVEIHEPSRSRPPVDLRRDDSTVESDRRALRQEEMREPNEPQRPPPTDYAPRPRPDREGAPNESSPVYREVFAGTPYMSAPRVVQEDTLRRAQRLLGERGLFRAAPDGQPSVELEDALISYQRVNRLRISGQLDLETLQAMHLLPGRGPGNPALEPYHGERPVRSSRQPVYKGIWVQ